MADAHVVNDADALEKLAPETLALVKFADVNVAFERLAPIKLALLKTAFDKRACDKLAPGAMR